MNDQKNSLALKPLPAGWRWVKLGEVILETLPGFAIGKRDQKGVVQLRMNIVDTRGRLNWDEFIRVPVMEDTIARYSLKPGDVMFNNTNSTELVGKSALFTGYPGPIVYSNHFTPPSSRAKTHHGHSQRANGRDGAAPHRSGSPTP